jgi:hypothetical protein
MKYILNRIIPLMGYKNVKQLNYHGFNSVFKAALMIME